ncbi:WD40-repeat-containing domain protein, partial [Chytriomyces sp. MP71]
SLATCLRVSRSWAQVARDNACWRAAFRAAWPRSFERVAPRPPSIVDSSEKKRSVTPVSTVGSSYDPAYIDWKHVCLQRHLLDRNWRTGTYTATEIPTPHKEAIYCLQFDRDKIVSGSRDHTVRIHDAKTLQLRSTLVGHIGSVLCLQFDKTSLVTGSSDSRILIWSLPPLPSAGDPSAETTPSTIHPTHILKGHTESVLNLKFDSSRILSCSKDKTIKVWSSVDGSLLRTLKGHRAAVNAVQFRGRLAVSASGDRTIKVWDLETGENMRTLVGHVRGIACVQFEGDLIVSGSSDKTIRIWNVHTGQHLRTLDGHMELVRTLQFDESIIVSGSYDQSIKVWDMKSGSQLLALDAHRHRVFKVQFNECRIVSCSQDQRIIVWDFTSGVDTSFF